MIVNLVQIPKNVQALKIEFPFKEVAPEWLLNAYKTGSVQATYNYKGSSYITVYGDGSMTRAYTGDWICYDDGRVFVLTDEEKKRSYRIG